MNAVPLLSPAPGVPPNADNLKDKILATLGGDDPVIMTFSNLSLTHIRNSVDKLIREAVAGKVSEVRKHALQQIHLTIQEISVNPPRIRLVLGILSSAVKDGVLTGREVCACLKELLNTDIENLSMELLHVLDILIGCTDHRICHEIFTSCLQETSKLPSVLSGAHHRISKKIHAMLVKLLDRNSLVMPPICAYCDIMKAFTKPNVYPHWTVSELLNNYVSTFNSLTQLMTIENTENFRPVVRHSFVYTPLGWKLDQQTLTFDSVNPNFFILRFTGHYAQPQIELMLYTLRQPGCRDLVVSTMLCLRAGKGIICPQLEDVFMKVIMETAATTEEDDMGKLKMWERIGGELTSLIFANAVNIKNITKQLLRETTSFSALQLHRDFLMWMLLRCFTFCLKVMKLPKKEFLKMGDMIKWLYQDTTPLPLPDITSPLSVVYLSAASMWALFSCRSGDNPGMLSPPPMALRQHLDFLQSTRQSFSISDYTVCIMLNYVNNFISNLASTPDSSSPPLSYLMDSIYINSQNLLLPGNVQVVGAVTPIPIKILDMLSAHAKMNFILTISNHITKVSSNRDSSTSSPVHLTPALLETYSRLLSYSEIEFLSIKMMMNLYMTVSNNHCFGVLSGLMEMFVYRMQYMKQTQHRMNMLTHCQQMAMYCQQKNVLQPQMLYLCESYTIRLMHLFNHHDHTRMSSSPAGVKILSSSTEEVNKAFMLSLARSTVVSGNKFSQNPWISPFVEHMMASTPGVRDWSSYTMKYFPQSIQQYCSEQQQQVRNLTEIVNQEIARINPTRQDIAKYFRENDQHDIFLCITLRKTMDTDIIPKFANKVTQSWSPAVLKKQIRNMVEWVVLEVKASTQSFTKITNTLSDLCFRYFLIPFDLLILIASLRKYSENDAYIAFFLIYNLLVKKMNFRERVDFLVARASPIFWKQSDWNAIHTAFHSAFPEHQLFMKNDFAPPTSLYLPVYYTNICFRFIPVLDILLHRLIELPPKNSRNWMIEILLGYGKLYAYHDTPLTFLHDTLFYYDSILPLERDLEKRVLVRAILEAQPTRPLQFLSAQFINYLKSDEQNCKWEPSPGYYLELLHKMNDIIKKTENKEFDHIDWRYNEFGNPVCFILNLLSIELLCVPLPQGSTPDMLLQHRLSVATKLLDIVLANKALLRELSNTMAVILSSLPVCYSQAVYKQIAAVVGDKSNFMEVSAGDNVVLWSDKAQHLLILVHSFFQHCKADKIAALPGFITDNLHLFSMESQVVYLLKLTSPFLCHLIHSPVKTPILCALYQVMFNLMGEQSLSNPDLFVDFMYYIKYIIAKGELKQMIEKNLPLMPADISAKLKFLVQGTEVDTF